MLDQIYKPQLARFSCPGQKMVNDQVQWHAHTNFAALATAMELVPPPLQMYTQATGELQLQARQRNYLSKYGLPVCVQKRHAKTALA